MYSVQITGMSVTSSFRTSLFSAARHSGCAMTTSSGASRTSCGDDEDAGDDDGDAEGSGPFSIVSTETSSLLVEVILPMLGENSDSFQATILSRERIIRTEAERGKEG